MSQVEENRNKLKAQEYQRRKKYYQSLEEGALNKAKSKFTIDYKKKFDKSRKRYETSFDEKTAQLVKNTDRVDAGKKVVKYKTKKKVIGWQDVKNIIQKYVRLRDSDIYGYGYCIVTGEKLFWKRANGGHYISASYKKTALNLDNIHFQSPSSNKKMSMGDKESDQHLAKYRLNLIDKIGLRKVENLELEHETWKYQTYSYNKVELKEIYDKFKILSKELEVSKQPLPR